MHRSRLAGFIIDCRTDDLEAAAKFWGEALGMHPEPQEDPTQPVYVRLQADHRDLHIEVQKVEHESRVHLDIEADDIEAEVTRLEKLGARQLAKVRTWVVMEAPTGQRFCVVRGNRARLTVAGNRWGKETTELAKPGTIAAPVGTVGTASLTVATEHLANRLKDVILPPVLATPVMITLMENAALNALKPYLTTGNTAVGTRIDVRHLAATPLGRTVMAKAIVTEVEGRRIAFAVEAHDGDRLIGEGRHERRLIDLDGLSKS